MRSCPIPILSKRKLSLHLAALAFLVAAIVGYAGKYSATAHAFQFDDDAADTADSGDDAGADDAGADAGADAPKKNAKAPPAKAAPDDAATDDDAMPDEANPDEAKPAETNARPFNPLPAIPAPSNAPFRAIVPGVEVTIASDREPEDTFANHDVVEILQGVGDLGWTPKLHPLSTTLKDKSTNTVFRRKVWYLEFTFKPVRMLWVDIPDEKGKMQRKLVWYMVYHVTNMGGHLNPKLGADGTFGVEKVNDAVTFTPHFVLEAPEYKKAYLDRLIPVAIGAIEQREDPKRTLLNSVEIAAKPIPLSTEKTDRSVWGVATWVDIDPRVDFFTIYVQGLTNAYKWVDPPGAFKKGDEPGAGRVLTKKTLVLNFWRPGDEFVEDQRIIYYGIPGKVDFNWVYR